MGGAGKFAESRHRTRTGTETAGAACRASPRPCKNKDLPDPALGSLVQVWKEEAAGQGRRFRSGREAIRWLET